MINLLFFKMRRHAGAHSTPNIRFMFTALSVSRFMRFQCHVLNVAYNWIRFGFVIQIFNWSMSWLNTHPLVFYGSAAQSQKAVTAYFTSKQFLPSGFEVLYLGHGVHRRRPHRAEWQVWPLTTSRNEWGILNQATPTEYWPFFQVNGAQTQRPVWQEVVNCGRLGGQWSALACSLCGGDVRKEVKEIGWGHLLLPYWWSLKSLNPPSSSK